MKISNQQKNGIIQLSFLMIVSLAFLCFSKVLPSSSSQFVINSEIQSELDKQKLAFEEKKKQNFKKFYVNSINDYIGYKLGLNTNQIDRLLTYFDSGKLVYNPKQFKKITALSDTQFQAITNKIRFPKTKPKTKKKSYKKHKNKFHSFKKFDLNTISAQQLEKDLKLPQFIAARIVKFRKLLKGYKNMEEIEKVYSILPYQTERIKKYCYIK